MVPWQEKHPSGEAAQRAGEREAPDLPIVQLANRRRWSRRVTERSGALTLEKGVFTARDPKRIAASLKRSAQRSRRRKADPYRSALSMLAFYINRAGKNLPASRKKTLMRAKGELRKQFRKDS